MITLAGYTNLGWYLAGALLASVLIVGVGLLIRAILLEFADQLLAVDVEGGEVGVPAAEQRELFFEAAEAADAVRDVRAKLEAQRTRRAGGPRRDRHAPRATRSPSSPRTRSVTCSSPAPCGTGATGKDRWKR